VNRKRKAPSSIDESESLNFLIFLVLTFKFCFFMRIKLRKILLPAAGVLLMVVSVLVFQNLMAGIGIGLAGMLVFGPNVEQEKGKTGGIVYITGKTGPYTRARIKPKNPKTDPQATMRQMMRNYAKLWKTSQVNQTSFIDYAATHPVQNRMGRTSHISGFNWFVKFNRIAQMAISGVSLITAAPTVDTLFPILTGLTVATTTGSDSVTVQPVKIGNYPTGMKIEIFATAQFSAGVFTPHGYKQIGVYDPTTNPAIDITSDYEAKYTALQDGLKIFFKARLIMPTGESDLFVTQNSLVIAQPTS